jgi:hypothetical protein
VGGAWRIVVGMAEYGQVKLKLDLHNKPLYHRVEKDADNFGRVFVHFRWK